MEAYEEVIPDERTDVEDRNLNLDREPKLQETYAALEKLPPFAKDCIILKYLEDHSTAEIAEITDQSESYVRQGLSRSLKPLRPMLQTLKLLMILILLTLS